MFHDVSWNHSVEEDFQEIRMYLLAFWCQKMTKLASLASFSVFAIGTPLKE